MQYGLKMLGFGFALAAGIGVSACGGEDDGGDPGSDGGTTSAGGSSAGSAGSGTGGTSANGGTGAGSAGGSSGGSGSGGAAGSSANGGTAGTGAGAGAGAGGTGTSGGSGGTGGGEACIPASTDGIAFSGSCTYADHCTDEYDTSFGAEVLEQLCTGQSGTWSTAQCIAADWDKKCTQEVLGGVYVQYLKPDGICALGCEEAL